MSTSVSALLLQVDVTITWLECFPMEKLFHVSVFHSVSSVSFLFSKLERLRSGKTSHLLTQTCTSWHLAVVLVGPVS